MKQIEQTKNFVEHADLGITARMARYGLTMLRLSLGVVVGAIVRGGRIVAEPLTGNLERRPAA